MKFIQTLYFDKSINPFKHSFGWAAPEYHLMGWALSCLQLQRLHKKVDLYCNSKAASLLKDELGLPYANVFVTHDGLNVVNEKLWALPKVFTYSLQDEPFLHIDGDVFLFKELPASLLESGLIAQNIEEASNYYLSTQMGLMKYLTYFPNCVRNDFNSAIPIKAVNAGILGGNNIAFIKEYSTLAFEYVNRNAENLSLINVDRFNVFFEQHLFYSLATEKGLPIAFLFKDTIMANEYQHLGDFHEVPCKKNYLHLLGQYKRDEYTCRQMAAKLRQLYPEYYYRIISLCKNRCTPLSISFYTDKKFVTVSDYIQFNEKSKESFSIPSYTVGAKISNNTDSSTLEKPELAALTLLKIIVNQIKDFSSFSHTQIENDFIKFSENLREVLESKSGFREDYIYGRDLESVNWFCDLFGGNDSDTANKMITKCNEISIIKSCFDWAGLLNENKRIGIKYY